MSRVAGSAVIAALVVAAVVLQTAVLSQVAILGVVPDLTLVLVVAVALVRGPEMGTVVGFLAGLAVDLAPPADHVAGRWALALALVGYLAGSLRYDGERPLDAVLAVGAGSFVATSVFAISGFVVHDSSASIGRTLAVIGVGVVLDVVVAPLVMPWLMGLLRRTRTAHAATVR